MTMTAIFTIISIGLTAINAGLTYWNLRHNRKKDFQDKLYQLKLTAYTELSAACYEATKQLDINSSPFVEIYDFDDKDKWSKYCEKNMGEQFAKSFDMQKLTYRHTLYLPSNIVDKYHEFTNYCISFVTTSYHFDTGLIISNQDRLWGMYIDLLKEFRKDLNIDMIDGDLRSRITSKI